MCYYSTSQVISWPLALETVLATSCAKKLKLGQEIALDILRVTNYFSNINYQLYIMYIYIYILLYYDNIVVSLYYLYFSINIEYYFQ